jgi:hypothetical protein
MSNTGDDLIEAFKKMNAEKMQTQPCPSCGHCPTCGRGGYGAYPVYPLYPAPYWPRGPWVEPYITWTTSGTLLGG